MITQQQIDKSNSPRAKELVSILEGFGERYNERVKEINKHMAKLLGEVAETDTRIEFDLGRSYCYINFFQVSQARYAAQIQISYSSLEYNFDKPGELGEFDPEVMLNAVRVKKGNGTQLEKDYLKVGALLVETLYGDAAEIYAEIERCSRELIIRGKDAELLHYQKELTNIIKAEEQAEQNEKLSAILAKLTPGATFYPKESSKNRVAGKMIYRKESPKFFFFDLYLKTGGDTLYFSRAERVNRENITHLFDNEWELNTKTKTKTTI